MKLEKQNFRKSCKGIDFGWCRIRPTYTLLFAQAVIEFESGVGAVQRYRKREAHLKNIKELEPSQATFFSHGFFHDLFHGWVQWHS